MIRWFATVSVAAMVSACSSPASHTPPAPSQDALADASADTPADDSDATAGDSDATTPDATTPDATTDDGDATADDGDATADDSDAAADDDAPDATGPSAYPNIAQVLGYPWTAGPDPTENPAWRATCEAELPTNTTPSLPPMPATPSNCAGDSTKCGPSGAQDCAAEPAASAWLHRVTLDTEAFPDAVCNDGSPGLMEVRRGTGAGANDWLIWFKGGSHCYDQHHCARRWCGNQSGSKYTAGIMSTDWNGDGIVDRPQCALVEANSAFDRDLAGNPFAAVNVVKIWYCSSDTHIGRATVDYEDTDPDSDGVPRPFSAQVKGRRIVEAVLATLDQGVTSDDGVVSLPSLTAAKRVVIAGSSAGSAGATQNLDAMREHIVGNAPGAQVRGVLDAALAPSGEALDSFHVYIDAAFDELQTPGVPLSQWLSDQAVASWTSGWYAAADAFVDQSCLAYVQATEGDAGMHRCLGQAKLLTLRDAQGPVLETPVFVRQDLGDGVVGGGYKPCRDAVTDAPCYAAPNHGPLADAATPPARWLDLLDGSDHNRATVTQVFQADNAVTGVFSPACGTHTGFANSNFSQQVARDYANGQFSGPPATFMATLAAWLHDQTPTRVIDASKSSPDAPVSQCDGTEG